MLDGFRTSQTDGAFPDPVIIHGYSSKAPARFGCLLVRVDKRVTKWFNAFLSGVCPGSNLAIMGATALFSVTGVDLGTRDADVTCARSLISSNGEHTSDSNAPATIPAIRASETYT
jgi:hypothetical protein